MPFSSSDFFGVFARYNYTVWPAQIILYVIALVIVAAAFRKTTAAARLVYALLAVLWIWMGVVYHASFFAAINPVALAFAFVFLIQSFVFVMLGASRFPPLLSPRNDAPSLVGGALVIVALVVYPILSNLSGHFYPALPTFGLPCPTTIFTLGILLWAPYVRRGVYAIPVAWSIVGSFGALTLGVPEDLSLALALVCVAAAGMLRSQNARRTSHA